MKRKRPNKQIKNLKEKEIKSLNEQLKTYKEKAEEEEGKVEESRRTINSLNEYLSDIKEINKELSKKGTDMWGKENENQYQHREEFNSQ